MRDDDPGQLLRVALIVALALLWILVVRFVR